VASYARDPREFHEQLAIQRRHLRRSAWDYDHGDESEALRLAVVVRVLVHDTRNSVSLLTHLGVKDRLRFVDTSLKRPPNMPRRAIMLHAGLVTLRMGPRGVRFVPPLSNLAPERQSPSVDFEPWWSTPVVRDQRGHAFARSDFILNVANKDGGAHIDAILGPAYAALTRSNSLGVTGSDSLGVQQPLGKSVALASVRQISFELDQTLRAQGEALGLEWLALGRRP
jgi:hypothetical protein